MGIASSIGKGFATPLTPFVMAGRAAACFASGLGGDKIADMDEAGGCGFDGLGSVALGGDGSLVEGPSMLANDIGLLVRSLV